MFLSIKMKLNYYIYFSIYEGFHGLHLKQGTRPLFRAFSIVISNLLFKYEHPLYICEYLKITPSEFFDISSNNPAKLKPLIEKLKFLNDEQLASITNIVNDLVKLND